MNFGVIDKQLACNSFKYNFLLKANILDLVDPNHKWNKLANMIINEDEEKFRKNLLHINNALYLELANELDK